MQIGTIPVKIAKTTCRDDATCRANVSISDNQRRVTRSCSVSSKVSRRENRRDKHLCDLAASSDAASPQCSRIQKEQNHFKAKRFDSESRQLTKKLSVNFPISEELALDLAVRYPGYEFIENRKLDFRTHQHPISSVERRICEMRIFDAATSDGNVSIVDIGGNVSRHLANNRAVHSCNPILSPEDNNRNWRYLSKSYQDNNWHGDRFYRVRNSSISWCTHSVANCVCVQPDCYVSVHSLYYFTPGQVLKLLYTTKNKVFYASCHLFENLIGHYFTTKNGSEASYEFSPCGSVFMQVKGNASVYEHGNMEWLKSMYYSDGKCAMSWSIDMVGETACVVFRSCIMGLNQRKGMTFRDSLHDKNYYGMVDINLKGDTVLSSGFLLESMMKSKLMSIGSYMIAYSPKSAPTLVPKGFVDKIAMSLLGTERDRNSWKTCIARTRTAMADRKLLIPESIRAASCIYVAALAYVKFLEEEMNVTNAMIKMNETKFKWYNSLLAFNPLPSLLCCFTGRSEFDPIDTYNTRNGASTCGDDYCNENRTFIYSRVERELTPIKKNASVKIIRDVDEKERKFHQIGLGFRDHIPVAPATSQQHEMIAVNNRALMQSPEPNQKLWERIIANSKLMPDSELEPVDYDLWNSKFPLGRRTEHDRAKTEVDLRGLYETDFFRSAFIKTELYNKSTDSGSDNYDPRLIQGVSSEANVSLGPFMESVSNWMKENFSINDVLTYACGLTAEDVGSWMDKCLERYGDDALFFWSDFSRYDATQGQYCFDHELNFLKRLGIEKYPLALQTYIAQKNTRGYTRNGVAYRVPNTRKSGDPNTSCGNSFINGSTCVQTMLDLNINDFKVIVMGDDMLCVMPRQQLNKSHWSLDCLCDPGGSDKYTRFINRYTSIMTAYGFIPKCGLSDKLYKAEFCSGLFWPTDKGTVLGPKPGRALPKMGFAVKNLSSDEIRGVFIGHMYNANHVPVLGEFIQWHLKGGEEGDIIRNVYSINCNEIHHCSLSAREFFTLRYGVSPEIIWSRIQNRLPSGSKTWLLGSGLIDELFNIDN